MALTNLTGTKWRFNNKLNISNGTNYSLNFTSNSSTFASIEPITGFVRQLLYGSVTVYDGEWTNEAYRLIEITGGADATNTYAIQWIQSNAEQIIDQPVLPSFSDVEVTPHDGYITMTINGVDFNLKTKASVSLISFSIHIRQTTASFNAEEGMTWEEWVDSAYNTNGFFINGINVCVSDLFVVYNGISVSPSDAINAEYVYTTVVGE